MEGALLMTVPYKGVPICNSDGTFRKEDDVVQGRSFSSNLTKMLKHMDKLEAIQQGKPPSPVMAIVILRPVTRSPSSVCIVCVFGGKGSAPEPPLPSRRCAY